MPSAAALEASDDSVAGALEDLEHLVGIAFAPGIEVADPHAVTVKGAPHRVGRNEEIFPAVLRDHKAVAEAGALEAADERASGHGGNGTGPGAPMGGAPGRTALRMRRRSGRAHANQRSFFLCRSRRSRFFRLCVAIFLRLRFFPLPIALPCPRALSPRGPLP